MHVSEACAAILAIVAAHDGVPMGILIDRMVYRRGEEIGLPALMDLRGGGPC